MRFGEQNPAPLTRCILVSMRVFATAAFTVIALCAQPADLVLRNGKIVIDYEGLASREKPGITEKTVRARAGAGGAFFKFTVMDGTVNIRKI